MTREEIERIRAHLDEQARARQRALDRARVHRRRVQSRKR